MTIGLELTRSQILTFRRRAASLDERLPRGQGALRRAAWAGEAHATTAHISRAA
jgi:hypothetical protein